MKFDELNLSSELLRTIQGIGLTTPTEIQEKSIPSVLKGNDVIGESATGSGKTLVFGCGNECALHSNIFIRGGGG